MMHSNSAFLFHVNIYVVLKNENEICLNEMRAICFSSKKLT